MAYSKRAKKYALISFSVGLMLAIGSMFNANASNGDDKIHFINVGNSDAVLIESNNRFALIDTGKDDTTELVEHEKVLEYLKKVAKDKNGNIKLDFIIATHPEKTSIGGLSEIIKDKDIEVSKIILENHEKATKRVRLLEDVANRESYYELINTISEKNIHRIEDPGTTIYKVGDFKLEFINTLAQKETVQFLEDSNSSIAIKVTKDNKSALIAGGLNNLYMDETRVSSSIGNIDLLLLANSGDKTAYSEPFLNMLSPKDCILSGDNKNLSPTTYSFIKNMNSNIYTTKDNGDIVATFVDGNINLNSNTKMSNGWYQDYHKRYYYNEKGELLKGFQNINNHMYFFAEDGVLHTGWLKSNDGIIYYANADGVIQKGLIKINVNGIDKIYNFNENGCLVTGWHYVYDKWYYLDENPESESYGSALTGKHTLIYNDAPRTFMFDENGAMLTGLIELNNRYHYFNDDASRGVFGEMLTGEHYLKIGDVERVYTFGENGDLKYK